MSLSAHQHARNRELNARVCRAVRESELTAGEIAGRLGISASNISRWLTRGAVPSPAVLERLPYVLRVAPEWLLANRGPMRGDGKVPAPNRPQAEFEAGGWQALQEVAAALARVREAWAERAGATRGVAADGRAADLAASAPDGHARPGQEVLPL